MPLKTEHEELLERLDAELSPEVLNELKSNTEIKQSPRARRPSILKERLANLEQRKRQHTRQKIVDQLRHLASALTDSKLLDFNLKPDVSGNQQSVNELFVNHFNKRSESLENTKDPSSLQDSQAPDILAAI